MIWNFSFLRGRGGLALLNSTTFFFRGRGALRFETFRFCGVEGPFGLGLIILCGVGCIGLSCFTCF